MGKNHYISLEKGDVLFVNGKRLFAFDGEGFRSGAPTENENYKVKTWKQTKEMVNGLVADDVKRITLDIDDAYTDETNININIELNK